MIHEKRLLNIANTIINELIFAARAWCQGNLLDMQTKTNLNCNAMHAKYRGRPGREPCERRNVLEQRLKVAMALGVNNRTIGHSALAWGCRKVNQPSANSSKC